jgi:hypothetical protein
MSSDTHEHRPDRLLTKRQAADRLGGLHPRTIKRWADHGFLKLCRIGSREFVRESELARLIAEGAMPAE